jgi:extensin-like protein
MAAPAYPSRDRATAPYSPRPDVGTGYPAPLPRLGPPQGNSVAAFGPVAVRPAATLACPIVSVLDRWLADSVQPAAMRWFGARVVEIKQISAYSCRGMNGNSYAHISEHAFGNALDIAGFTLADGRHISVRDGWKGLPEEQGFLRDVQATACQQFTTVLAPGSNVYHYDHIHVDLMRRTSRRLICQPAAMSGEEVAARAAGRNPYASREPNVTGSLGGRKVAAHRKAKVDEEDEFEDE